MNPAGDSFFGPLFLVGMPRSGTKLLRTLVSAHSDIAILPSETEFLPFMVERWLEFGDVSRWPAFLSMYERLSRFAFFVRMEEAGRPVEAKAWYRSCRSFSPAGVFEGLVRLVVGVPYESDAVWGDKSPLYLHYIRLLKDLYPDARFVHIVRDVRDYCLSMQNAWGQNPYRAAQRWVDRIGWGREAGAVLGNDYLEVRYEDLLADPEEILKQVCTFSGRFYEPGMVDAVDGVENLGDTRGRKGIVADNVEKYRTRMPDHQRRRIEQIAGDTLEALGYGCQEWTRRPVSAPAMRWYRLKDAGALLGHRIRERGLLAGTRFAFDVAKRVPRGRGADG